VFVEVKLRRGSGFGDPLESVTPRKQATIRALAEGYIADREPDFEDARFDVVGILETEGGREIQHIEDAF
jgi:putative endonuclease